MDSAAPVAPEPDGKDWTWVLERPCPECGFDAAAVRRAQVGGDIRRAATALRTALTGGGATVRPRPDVWSVLEYACHVRDVCIVFGTRLALMIGADNPAFPNWDQDETAVAERYWEQEPATVSAELGVETDRLAGAFDAVREDEWDRPGRRSNGSEFTVDTLARYLLHDLVHHVHDVTGA